jgi:hypothetical protein
MGDHSLLKSRSAASLFSRWDDESWIRRKPFREPPTGALPFSPDLVPLARHPAVVSAAPDAGLKVLGYRLLAHLEFTAHLEIDYVNPACAALAMGRCHVAMDEAARLDLLKIYCDEGGHALFVRAFAQTAAACYELDREVVGRPQFEVVMDRIIARYGTEVDPQVLGLFFCAVSETLVSRVLFGIPKDPQVDRAVRDVLHDHAMDERLHGAFFRRIFPVLWRGLSQRERDVLGQVLPEFVWTFLGPDRRLEGAVLRSFGFDQAEAAGILMEVYPPGDVGASVRHEAGPTLHMFAEAGIFEASVARDAFHRYQLLDEQGGLPASFEQTPGEALLWGDIV